jgi:hypothetical protein
MWPDQTIPNYTCPDVNRKSSRSRIWCEFSSDQMWVLCELKTPSRVNLASSVVKTMLKKLGSSSIF